MLQQAAADYARPLMEHNDASHDWSHIERVLANARAIIRAMSAEQRAAIDEDVAEAGAILHDVADHKYTDDVAGATDACMCHMATVLGVDETCERLGRLRAIIERTSYTEQQRELAHDPRPPSFPELDVVRDADKLDALGEEGLARVQEFARVRNIPDALSTTMTVAEWTVAGCPQLPEDGSMAGHFYAKLFHLADLMATAEGTHLARQRVKCMEEFVDTRLVLPTRATLSKISTTFFTSAKQTASGPETRG